LRQKLVGEARAELDLTRAVADLEEELRQMELGEEVKDGKKKKRRTVETVRREIEEAQSKLAAIRSIDNNGWILIDFPSTLSQAMLLEKALSGYQMEAELEPT
jgi:adenylate kinase family enzyme